MNFFFAKWFDLTWAIDTLIFCSQRLLKLWTIFPLLIVFSTFFFFRRCRSSAQKTAKAAQRHCINLHLTFSLCNFLNISAHPAKTTAFASKRRKARHFGQVQNNFMVRQHPMGGSFCANLEDLSIFRIVFGWKLSCCAKITVISYKTKQKRVELTHNGHETFPIYLFYSAWKGLCNYH